MTNLNSPQFNDEAAAIEHMEASRWPSGAICPHCGVDTVTKMGGKTQAGMFQCNGCREKFTVRTGTVFERSHIPLHKWLLAMHLMASSKKGISAHQLHRMLGITYKSAWFMAHRIREAMRHVGPTNFGEGGGSVESDETYIGKKAGERVKAGVQHKMKVLTLIDRTRKEARSTVMDTVNLQTALEIVAKNASYEARLMTDNATHYRDMRAYFADHQTVNHSAGEYVRGEAHTNTAEGFFSIFKRGMKGIYQHCDEQHLHRYTAEFDFRYNNRTALGVNDDERAARILKGAEGKRLTYNQSH